MTNFSKLDAAIDWAIEEDAKAKRGEVSLWDQRYWASQSPVDCGTACCLAGNIVSREGGKFAGFYEGELWDEGADMWVTVLVSWKAVDGEGRWHEIDEWATEILETTQYVYSIFGAENTIDDIKSIRDDWAEDEGVPTRWR